MGLVLILSEKNEAGRGNWLMVIMTHKKTKIKATASPKMNKIRLNDLTSCKVFLCNILEFYSNFHFLDNHKV